MTNLQYIDFDQYQRVKAINFSCLKEMKKSPLHYKYRIEHARVDTVKLALGRAAHTAILDPDRFLHDYVLFKGKDRRSKKYKEFKKLHEGQTVLLEKEYVAALAMRDAVRADDIARPLLTNGHAEQSITWIDPSTGLKCKARLDWNGDVIADVKTTGSVNGRRFGRIAGNFGYHEQGAMYRDGVTVVERKVKPYWVIAVEAAPPHAVACFELDDEVLDVGQSAYLRYLARVQECTATGKWPGPYTEPQRLELPAYLFGDDDEGMTAEVVSGNNGPAQSDGPDWEF